MAEQVVLNANNRDSEGKSSNRQLRRAGSVPAVIYGGEQEPIRISILETSKSSNPSFVNSIQACSGIINLM